MKPGYDSVCLFLTSFSRLSAWSWLSMWTGSPWRSLFSLRPWRSRSPGLSWRSWYCTDGDWWTGCLVQDGVVARHVAWKQVEGWSWRDWTKLDQYVSYKVRIIMEVINGTDCDCWLNTWWICWRETGSWGLHHMVLLPKSSSQQLLTNTVASLHSWISFLTVNYSAADTDQNLINVTLMLRQSYCERWTVLVLTLNELLADLPGDGLDWRCGLKVSLQTQQAEGVDSQFSTELKTSCSHFCWWWTWNITEVSCDFTFIMSSISFLTISTF